MRACRRNGCSNVTVPRHADEQRFKYDGDAAVDGLARREPGLAGNDGHGATQPRRVGHFQHVARFDLREAISDLLEKYEDRFTD